MMTEAKTVEAYVTFVRDHFGKDMSVREIAKALDLTQPQVRMVAASMPNHFRVAVNVRKATAADAYGPPCP